ncbi:MAG: hypothetical protein QM758_18285 [Armatimonas sp.]
MKTSTTRAAVLTLLLLSPIIGEVMSGATRLSYIIVLVPEIMVWGCGTLLIRELVRRWGGGWLSVFLLGLGLAVAEEFLIQQTSLAPLPWLGNQPTYGRAFGVNWVYFLYMLGFESVWIVLVPTSIAELLFPEKRDKPWLGIGGMITTVIVFLLGSFIAWFAWIKIARSKTFHVPDYHPAIIAFVLGTLAILLLGVAGYALRNVRPATSLRHAPKPTVVAIIAFIIGIAWQLLLAIIFVPSVQGPVWIPLTLGLALAGATLWGIRNWTGDKSWSEQHIWALAFGALVASMLGGFAGANAWPQTDLVGKIVLNLLGIAGMLWLSRRLHSIPRGVQ